MKVMCHILLKSSQQGLQLIINLISIEGLKTKLWVSKVVGVPILGISRLPRQNDIWVLALWLSTKNTIRGKVVASPNFKP
jgi:hypothetical protein